MTTTPHLLAEDRPDFERILDEALRDGSILAALAEPGPHLTTAQLRTKALLAADTVAATAAADYRHYTELRTALLLRSAPPASPAGPGAHPAAASGGPRPAGRGARSGPGASDQGVGLLPALTVLAPILAWSAAAVLLLLGYTLRATSPELALGRAVVTAGWAALAVGVATLVVGAVGLLLTALRDGAAPPPEARAKPGPGPADTTQPDIAGAPDPNRPGPVDDPGLLDDLAEARLAWHTALRERALLPYLHANLHSEPALPPQPTGRPNPPELLSPGYTSATFASPGYTSATFTSPGFTSPGGENLTDPEGRTPRTAEFSSPGYSPPGFTGPDEV
ncbi:hypothetical protein [Saccharothrix sp. ST-888]|uniref:hypothetical protein n=1 Tax=Saccharothrix sp. ST-888 TaxID=1427391 RepID=UPI0012E07BC2|nr:hypothetical protein [Saccharothrix sp. ST-888]